MVDLDRLSSEEILRLSRRIARDPTFPARRQAINALRKLFVEKRMQETRAMRRGSASMAPNRSVWDEPAREEPQLVECHVCDGRGEYSGRNGRRECIRCYGKGVIPAR